MKPVATEESSLLEGLRAGSRDAFREAVARYSGPMLATARAIAGPGRAEDVVQEAWLTVYQKIDGFEGRSGLATWLQRIVTNQAISVLRKFRREVTAADLPDAVDDAPDWFDREGNWSSPPPAWNVSSPEALLTADELQECIDKHIALMSDHQRTVLVMRDMQVLSFEEICAAVELSATNARVLLHRARLRLVDMINRFQETGTC
ncbi:MAG: RNA polymerase sigma factor [Gammaproteobacteria bacterium]